MNPTLKCLASRFAMALLCLCVTSQAYAAPLEITETPQSTSGPFRHNVFHTAGSNGGASGSIIVWFDLDTSQTSTFDPDTGDLDLHVNLYNNSSFTTLVGTAVGTSSDFFDVNVFTGTNTNNLVGTIDWDFTLNGSATTFMTNNLVDSTLKFLDHDYVTSSSGDTANSFVPGITQDTMTLWGADGTPDSSNGKFTGSSLGMDLVFKAEDNLEPTGEPIPTPAAAGLGLSLLGLLGITRPRRPRAG